MKMMAHRNIPINRSHHFETFTPIGTERGLGHVQDGWMAAAIFLIRPRYSISYILKNPVATLLHLFHSV